MQDSKKITPAYIVYKQSIKMPVDLFEGVQAQIVPKVEVMQVIQYLVYRRLLQIWNEQKNYADRYRQETEY